jgi:hypothetical protein
MIEGHSTWFRTAPVRSPVYSIRRGVTDIPDENVGRCELEKSHAFSPLDASQRHLTGAKFDRSRFPRTPANRPPLRARTAVSASAQKTKKPS